MTTDEIAARTPGRREYRASIALQLGNRRLGFGVLLMAVAAGSFRRGRWVTMSIAPLAFLLQLRNSREGKGGWADLGAVIVGGAGLIWPYRRFVPTQAER